MSNNFGLLGLIVLGGIIGPFIEELIFRLPLNYKRNYLFKLAGLILGKNAVRNFWFNNFPIFFYLFILAFGALHISNYQDESIGILLLSPLLVLPQLIGGTVLAYLRMHLGFLWSFLQHAIFNIFFMIIAFYSNIQEKVIIDNEDFTLQIEVAQNRFGNEKFIKINQDFDFITEIETEYASYNQIARKLNWDSVAQNKNHKYYNIDFRIKKLDLDSDSVLQHHLLPIVQD